MTHAVNINIREKLNIMKNILYLYIPILFLSCYNIKITNKNETRITEKPFHIDKTEYTVLRDTFKIKSILAVNDLTGSLSPKYPMAMASEHLKQSNCLFYYGCIAATGFSLIIKAEDGFKILRSRDDLKKYFAPIESPEEALSYLYISTGLTPLYKFNIGKNFRKFVNSINTTSSIRKNNGYEVNLFEYQHCGCGPHSYRMFKYFVGANGDIEKIEAVKLYEDPNQDGFCVD